MHTRFLGWLWLNTNAMTKVKCYFSKRRTDRQLGRRKNDYRASAVILNWHLSERRQQSQLLQGQRLPKSCSSVTFNTFSPQPLCCVPHLACTHFHPPSCTPDVQDWVKEAARLQGQTIRGRLVATQPQQQGLVCWSEAICQSSTLNAGRNLQFRQVFSSLLKQI